MDIFDIIEKRKNQKTEVKVETPKQEKKSDPNGKTSMLAIEFINFIKLAEFEKKGEQFGSMSVKNSCMLKAMYDFINKNPDMTHEEFMKILGIKELKSYKKLAQSYRQNEYYQQNFVDFCRSQDIKEVAININGEGTVDLIW